MLPQKTVATMSIDGWVTGVKSRIDRAFTYWLGNYSDQSYVASDSIASFQHLIQKYGKTPEILCPAVESNLQTYLGGQFDSAEVTCTTREEPETGSFYTLVINVQVKENNVGYDVGSALIDVKDGSFYNLIKGL